MEELKYFFEQVSEFFSSIGPDRLSAIAAWVSLPISVLALRKNIKWKDKYKENAMSDAYEKCKELWQFLKIIDNNLDHLSPNCIGALDISQYFDRKDNYEENEFMKKRIRNTMKNAERTRESLIECRLRIDFLRQDFERLGYSLSRRNKKRMDRISDNVINIESFIKSYIDSTFDYFDDEELCNGMRFSRHSFSPKEETNSILTESMNKLKDEIYENATKTKELLKDLNYMSGISKLYKN